MEIRKQLGGKRAGAGRKPVLSKKKQISLYVEGSKILKFGSEEKMKESLYRHIDSFGEQPIVYPTPTPDAYNGSKTDKVAHDEPAQWAEPKSPITGLPPKLSDFDGFMEELKNANTVHQVEEIMRRAKGGIMFPRQKMELEAFAKKISADMFND